MKCDNDYAYVMRDVSTSLLEEILSEMSDKFSEKVFEKTLRCLVEQIPELDKTKTEIKCDYGYDKFGRMFRFVVISDGKKPPIKIIYIGGRCGLIMSVAAYVQTRDFMAEIKKEMECVSGFGKAKLEVEWLPVAGIDSTYNVLEARIFDKKKSLLETSFFNDEKVSVIKVRVREKVWGKELDKAFLKRTLIKRIIKTLERRRKFRKFEKYLKQIFKGFKINSGTTN